MPTPIFPSQCDVIHKFMNAPKSIEATTALAVTIDGISNQVSSIALGGAAVSSASVGETHEPTGDENRACKGNILSVMTTPLSNIQSERSFLSSEMIAKTEGVKFPSLEKKPVTESRPIRKWKLKPHSSMKNNVVAPAAAVLSCVNSSTSKTPPLAFPANSASTKTPKTCLRTPPPPMALRRKNAELYLPLPNLREGEFKPQVGEGLTPALKPRPTVLFLSPRKKMRCDDDEKENSDATTNDTSIHSK